MRALMSTKCGGPSSLSINEVADPKPGPNDVVISVRACGINFPDTLIIEDKYQFKPARPFSPGGEVSGIVEATGSAVTAVRKGDRVLGSMLWGGLQKKLRSKNTDASLFRMRCLLTKRQRSSSPSEHPITR